MKNMEMGVQIKKTSSELTMIDGFSDIKHSTYTSDSKITEQCKKEMES
jgi:hypothetical protein